MLLVLASIFSMGAYTISTSSQAYWQLANISLYGQLIFFLVSVSTISGLWLCFLSFILGDMKVILPHGDVSQRRLFCCHLCRGRNKSTKRNPGPFRLFPLNWENLSQTELLILLGLNNASASLLQWYCAPPGREPPLINGLIPCLQPVFAVPLSCYCLGDTRDFFLKSKLPLLATLVIFVGVLVSILPSQGLSTNDVGSESGKDVALWTIVNIVSQAPSAMALVGAQAYLLRSGVMEENANPWRRVVYLSRFVFYNQCGVGLLVGILWWLDILPWFGSGENINSWWNGVKFSFSCSLWGDTSGNDSSGNFSCPPLTPLWAALTVLPYGIYLAGIALVSATSAVFGNVLEVGQSAFQTLFWLIPGTNPAPSATPLWSALLSSALTFSGVLLYRWWESGQSENDALSAGGLQPLGEDATWYLEINSTKIISAGGDGQLAPLLTEETH